MSRYTVPAVESHTLAYGFDHVLGPFFSLFDENDDIVEEADYLFAGLTCKHLALYLIAHADAGLIPSTPRLTYHIDRLVLDLTI